MKQDQGYNLPKRLVLLAVTIVFFLLLFFDVLPNWGDIVACAALVSLIIFWL